MGPLQVLSFRVKEDLRVMVMEGYSTSPKTIEWFSIISKSLVGMGFTPRQSAYSKVPADWAEKIIKMLTQGQFLSGL